MSCEELQADLIEYLYDGLPPERQAELTAHLERCAACRDRLAQYDQVRDALDLLDQAPATAAVRPAWIRAAAAALLAGLLAGGAAGWIAGRRARPEPARPADEQRLADLLASLRHGDELLEQGQFGRVLDRASLLLERAAGTPMLPDAHRLLARARIARAEALLRRGDFAAARQALRQLAAEIPEQTWPAGLAQARRLRDDLERNGDDGYQPLQLEREGKLSTLLAEYPESPAADRALRTLAARRFKRLDAEARLAWLELVSRDPSLSHHARLRAGVLLQELGRKEQARQALRYAAAGPPRVAELARRRLEGLGGGN